MSFSAGKHLTARRVELAVECVAIADELEQLIGLAGKRVAVLKSEARALAGELEANA